MHFLCQGLCFDFPERKFFVARVCVFYFPERKFLLRSFVLLLSRCGVLCVCFLAAEFHAAGSSESESESESTTLVFPWVCLYDRGGVSGDSERNSSSHGEEGSGARGCQFPNSHFAKRGGNRWSLIFADFTYKFLIFPKFPNSHYFFYIKKIIKKYVL